MKKIQDLAQKSEKELHDLLEKTRVEFQNLTFKVRENQLKDVRAIRSAKRTIARILTELNTRNK